MLLGAFPNVKFDLGTTHFKSGDTVILYTDGVTEAMNATEEEYGVERLQSISLSNPDKPAETIVAEIYRDVVSFHTSDTFEDDFTLLVAKVA